MVKVSGKPTEESLEKLRNGIMLPPEPGLAGARGKKQPGVERRSFAVLTQPAVIQLAVDQENPWYEVTLTEGRNRQLRRMFEQVGHHIEKIKRVRYGSLTLDLEPGEFRHLTPKEVNQLRKSLDTPFKPRPVKVKRRDERPERKPRLDTARFVKGRRGKPSADAPAEATPTVVRRAPAGISRSATAPAYGSAVPRRAFTAREDRGPARGGFVRPRGPEFAAGGEERPKRTYTRKPEGVERTSDDRRPSDRRPSDRKAGDRGTSGGFERKPRSFDRKPSGDRFPRREGAPAKRGAAGLEGGARTAAPAGGFGFDKFAKPKFVKPSKHRDLGSDTSSGSDERKTFSVRPYSKERGAASDRDFSGKPGGFENRPGGFGKTGSFGKAGGFAKPGGFTGSRKFSKGPGKPTSGEGRTGGDSKRSGEFKRAGEARTSGRGGDFGKGFGARPGSASPRGGSSARPGGSGFKRAGGSGFAKPDFKGAGGGGARRPSSPARGSGPARRPSSGPSRPRRDE
jgi:23S rRNA pseudouridine2605 synthase